MTNFELLKEECENYLENNVEEDYSSRTDFDCPYDELSLAWGMTQFESFQKAILSVKRPKRFIVFGCGIGYQCFYFKYLFPEIPCIGIDIVKYRVDWGRSLIKKYLINGVDLFVGDIKNFVPQDGDLIWQNNLLFDYEFISDVSTLLFNQADIEIISYINLFKKTSLFDNKDYFEFKDNSGNLKIIKEKEMFVETSWTEDQNIFYYWRYYDNNFYDVNFIKKEFIIDEKYLKDYESMNFSKRFIKSEDLKSVYNKHNTKLKFLEMGFNVPELYFYTKDKCDLKPILNGLKTFVAKPAHFSESVDIWIKENIYQQIDLEKLNQSLNDRIDISDRENWRRENIGQIIDWKDCERGIIIEEYIDVIYELKVFVVFGEPVIGDLRTGSIEMDTVDFIKKENFYLNWDKEYDLITKFAQSLQIDFFRIDFLYDGHKLYASELTFMPGTFLPQQIQNLIANKLRMPYLKHYYPNLC